MEESNVSNSNYFVFGQMKLGKYGQQLSKWNGISKVSKCKVSAALHDYFMSSKQILPERVLDIAKSC